MHKLNGARMCCSSLLQPHTLGVGRVDAGGGREAYPVPTSTTQAGRRDAMSVASHNLSLCSRQTRAAVRWCGEGTTVSTTRMQHEEKSRVISPLHIRPPLHVKTSSIVGGAVGFVRDTPQPPQKNMQASKSVARRWQVNQLQSRIVHASKEATLRPPVRAHHHHAQPEASSPCGV
jgi:hypothetical protein